MSILEISHLCKSFASNVVIKDLSFAVPEHSIFGFVGKNGAGKTTVMKIILGLLKPDQGEIKILGSPVVYGNSNSNRFVGYLQDVPEFYGYMTAQEYLKLCGEITGMNSDKIKRQSQKLLELVGLSPADKKIGKFSRGMKQRLGIASALLDEPKLLICDEPTSALDPIGRKEVLDIFRQIKEETTILFSTHILSDVEKICNKIAVLEGGTLLLCGDIGEVRKRHSSNRLLVEFSCSEQLNSFMQIEAIKKFENYTRISGLAIVFCVDNTQQMERILMRSMLDNSIIPDKFEKIEPTLEDLFMEVVR